MADTIFYIPIYKTCPVCNGRGDRKANRTNHLDGCNNCDTSGLVQVLMPLDEFAKEIDLSEEATHNLMCYVRDL